MSEETGHTSRGKRTLLVVWFGVYLAMLAFPFAASTLLAPAAGVAFLIAGWAVGLAILVRLFRRGSWWVLAVPPVALVFWVATIAFGDAVLGWTA